MMFLGEFSTPDGILVTNRADWECLPIPTGWPGVGEEGLGTGGGDVNLADVTDAIRHGQWKTPNVE